MKDKQDCITQGTKISCKYKRSLYVFTNNSNYPKAKADYIQYFKILRRAIQDAKKRHYSRLIAKCNNKRKTEWNIIKKETGKVQSVEQVQSLLVKVATLKNPTNVAKATNNFFITINEKLNIRQIEKGDDTILKY
jgi:methionine synthase II (cobalamin-independent)